MEPGYSPEIVMSKEAPSTNKSAIKDYKSKEMLESDSVNSVNCTTSSLVTNNEHQATRCVALNDNKAGMQGLDKDKINQIIYEASKGSKFYENEKKRQEQLNVKIKEQKAVVESISSEQLQRGCQQVDKIIRELEETRDLSRTIVHVDMDAFYAAVEMRDNPSLKEKPMAVGSMSMLSTSNYAARRYGIRAAMPGFIGRKLCSELIIVPLNFDKYTAVSNTVKEILAMYDPNFVQMSLDEAYLDFTEHLIQRQISSPATRTFLLRSEEFTASHCTCDLNTVLRPYVISGDEMYPGEEGEKVKHLEDQETTSSSVVCHGVSSNHTVCSVCQKPFPPYTVKTYSICVEEAVLEMRNRIEQRTQLTASAGIAPNTMLAKICSDINKPNGQYMIKPMKTTVEDFISKLPVRKIPGIGKVTEKLLEALGVIKCQDLHDQRGLLFHVFNSRTVRYYMSISLGLGSSILERDGERKSISTEQTFGELSDPKDLLAKCEELCLILAGDLQQEKMMGKTITLKIKSTNYQVKSRSVTLKNYCREGATIFAAAKNLLETEIQQAKPDSLCLRLMGIRISHLNSGVNCSSSLMAFLEKRHSDGASLLPSSSIAASDSIGATVDFNKDSTYHYESLCDFAEENLITCSSKTNKEKKSASSGKRNTIVNYFSKEEYHVGTSNIFTHSQILTDIHPGEMSERCTQSEVYSNDGFKSPGPSASNSQQSVSPTLTDNHPATTSVEAELLPSTASDPKKMITCPVCSHQKYDWDLEQLNAHIDECLSRSAIRDILSDQQQDKSSESSKKRSQPGDLENTSDIKRRKTQNTLLSFLK